VGQLVTSATLCCWSMHGNSPACSETVPGTALPAVLDGLSLHVLGMGMAAVITAPLGFVLGCLHHS
jgi:hypothetical protein